VVLTDALHLGAFGREPKSRTLMVVHNPVMTTTAREAVVTPTVARSPNATAAPKT
jgi:hypothetical protein